MIHISNLKKTFRTGFFMQAKEALTGLSLDVKENDIYGFIGPNGAGKSTAIKILLGLLRYKDGEISLSGKDPLQLKAYSCWGV